MAKHVYYPRAVVRISVTAYTDLRKGKETTATFDAIPRSVSWERNPWNEADTAQVEFHVSRFPILPRNIKQALISVFAGDVGGIGPDASSIFDSKNLRFIGYIDDPEMTLNEDDGVIRFKARDYTALFLDSKRPSAALVPFYADRLDAALRRIVRSIPSDGEDAIKLDLRGRADWPFIKEGAPSRAHGERVPWKAEDTKWDLIKRACDPLGLIPRIALDRLIVSPVQGLSTRLNKPPFLVFGRNVAEYREKKNLKRLNEGVGLRAYDNSTHRMITALWPPEGDRAITKKLPAAKAKKAPPAPPIAGTQDKRHWFNYDAVASQRELDAKAKEVFEARRIQEFESTLKVHRMLAETRSTLDTLDGEFYDMTNLESGDTVIVDVPPEHRSLLHGARSSASRAALLREIGYSDEAARLCVDIFEGSTSGAIEMFARKANHAISEDGYQCDIELMNKLGTR